MNPYTETLQAGITFTMRPVAGGSFMMGSDDEEERERPIHSVQLADFYLCEHPVTQAVWQTIMGNNPSEFEHPKRPVECVSWHDAQSFIAALNAWVRRNPHAGRPAGIYCLPSEAQWEYAARGGQQSRGFIYAGSNKLDEVGYYKRNSVKTRPVGQLYANELGLYDMSGNVFEWCQDEWHDNYHGAPNDGSAWQINSNIKSNDCIRVVRGGSWLNHPSTCGVAVRHGNLPDVRNYLIGFRVCRVLVGL